MNTMVDIARSSKDVGLQVGEDNVISASQIRLGLLQVITIIDLSISR